MLIRAYGQYWNPDIIEWGKQGPTNKGKLLGDVRFKDGKTIPIDFWDAKGVYVLFDRFKCIYVGKALETSLGFRLRSHLSDRLAGRWDMFSFFSVSTVNKTTKNTRNPGQRQITQGVTINSFEALAILVADPSLNRKRERFKEAHEAAQVKQPNPRTDRNYYEDIIKKLNELSTGQLNIKTEIKKRGRPPKKKRGRPKTR
ncbi:MAG: hypothetical protein ACTHMV_06790 [Chitinophagaceae bacterium]